uniref:Uncharacterized protein n=1 Tax=Branchiostoma floridae TaxID=7739 RepID=C4A0K6_BRAFL|eukprot:XP_002585665.1 hypothetical protein BRAFLDRAFT_111595 [Branchiostoma floridae]
MWSLHRLRHLGRRAVTLVVEVPQFIFCVRHNANEFSFGWVFDSSDSVPRNVDLGSVNPGKSCGALPLGHSLSTIFIQTPAVVLVADGSLGDKPVPNTLEQCRRVWEYDGGISLSLEGHSIFRLVSMAKGNTSFEGVAMSFFQAHVPNTRTTTESGCNPNNNTHGNAKNITCILLTKDEHADLFFSVHQSQRQTHTTAKTYKRDTENSSSLTNYTEYMKHDYTSTERGNTFTPQLHTTPRAEVPPPPDHGLISVVVSAVSILVLLSFVLLALKLRSAHFNADDVRASDNEDIFTIPAPVAFPGLIRSASVPTCSREVMSDDVASCRSLPAVLHSVQPTYCEISDDVAIAQRPLPGLPNTYWEIPDDADSGVVRSASLPAVTCTRGSAEDDASSCRSLPAVLSFEPAYSEILDHIAAAQRPLPVLPRTYREFLDQEVTSKRPLPSSRHNYSQIPDDEESGPILFYDDVAEFSCRVLGNRGRLQNRRAARNNTTTTRRHTVIRPVATYGTSEGTKAQINSVYRNASEVKGIRARRQLRTALVSQPSDQGLRTYVNVTDAVLSKGRHVTDADIAFLASPDAYFTLPNTYWPWEIPWEETHNTPRRASLPLVTPPNTYWPWEIPIEETCNTSRRASLPLVTLPNTYWPWEIPCKETHNTSRRGFLPLATLPNTYWPWEIPCKGTRNTSRRASLPLVTLPNTYWPWEIPCKGTHNTPRRASLPLVTLPNTYWPWEIPSTLPNTYWPWEIPCKGTHNTSRRGSLPLVTLPNTYWPWEIPCKGTHNTPRRASLPLVTLPNTYWPWEIPCKGTHNTSRRASLPLVTLPNTYWPWEIPCKGAHNTPRRASLPLVTPPNTYWPWAISGEGDPYTPRRASLPLVTLPNTYWPGEIPGEGTPNTPYP